MGGSLPEPPERAIRHDERDSTVISLRQPKTIDDPLTTILRNGARRLLAQVIEAEADAFMAQMKGVRLPDGRERMVRHGHGPERLVQTGIGPVVVRRVKLRDRAEVEAGARILFSSAILPRWSRRTPSLDSLLPILYLRVSNSIEYSMLIYRGRLHPEPQALGTAAREGWQAP